MRRRREDEAPSLTPLERASVDSAARARYLIALADRLAAEWLAAYDREHEGDDGNARRYPPRARS